MTQAEHAPQITPTAAPTPLTPAAIAPVLAAMLESMHARIAAAVAGMDEDDLHRRVAPQMESVAEVVAAAAAEEYHWIGEALAGLPSPAERRERQAAGAAAHPLFELGAGGQFSQAIIAGLPAAAWQTPRPVDGGQWTGVECVLHVIGALGRALGKIEVLAELARR